ncbi:tetratricopeptide repeat protein [Streptomyces flaveolus]|uniref:tetratricopeptide repeat protein n=1 Tax=Streptomyces flaveolus TaxID=67297 RepID=UPI00343E2BAC
MLAVDGIPGIGKTALAVHFAHQVARDFPDGQLYADLRGFAPDGEPADPSDILQGFLDALGVAPRRIPAPADTRSALYRSVLADRRVLVVLDNARDLAQIRPLLPGTGNCMVIVTSRSRLTALAAAQGAHLLTLDVPSPAEATTTFLERVRTSRPDATPEEVRPLVERCGRLPLAVAIVAARAAAHPERTLQDIGLELSTSDHSLDGFSDDNLDNEVRGVFSWSYRTLGPRAAQLFRLLPLHPGPDVTAAALAGMAGITPREAVQAVGELVRARLLTVRARDRYRAHDLVLAYAAELAVQDERDRPAVRSRRYDHYRQTAHTANLRLRPGPQPAAPAAPLPSVAPEPPADTAAATSWYSRMCRQRVGCRHDWAATMRAALGAAREAEDVEGMARTHHGLAGAPRYLGDLPGALRHLEQARRHLGRAHSTDDLAHVLRTIGVVYDTQGDHVRAPRPLEAALDLLSGSGPGPLKATTLSMAGVARMELGDPEVALRLLRTAVPMFRDLCDLDAEGLTLTFIGQVLRHRRASTRSASYHERGIELMRPAGRRVNVAEELTSLGDVRLDARDVAGARRAWTDALGSLDDPDLPLAAQARQRPARLETVGQCGAAASVI